MMSNLFIFSTLGNSEKVDSQVHRHIRQVLQAPRIRPPKHNQVRTRERQQLAHEATLNARHSRPHLP